MQDAKQWSYEQFAEVPLSDGRLRTRLVQMGEAMARQPQASIPQQMETWANTKASYRFLDNDHVSHEQIQQQHWQKTRQEASGYPLVLIIQDTTQLDYTFYQVEGVGVIGNDKGRGLMLHTALAQLPDRPEVLGIMHQQVYVQSVTKTHRESSYQRAQRADRASFKWSRAVEAIGAAPLNCRWLYVADSEGDCFHFLETCLAHQADFLVRMCQNRCIQDWDECSSHLIDYLRQQEALVGYQVTVNSPDQAPHQAQVLLTYCPFIIQAPFHSREKHPIAVTGVRVWEPHPPADSEAVEWFLVSSYPIADVEDAMQLARWYAQRPVIEDYHQCLKTGCRIEQRQLKTAQRLQSLVGILALVALRLLQLRALARQCPEDLASHYIEPDTLLIVAYYAQQAPQNLTMGDFWLRVACVGGYLARKYDPPPGWKILWRGWDMIQKQVEGFRLAKHLDPQQFMGKAQGFNLRRGQKWRRYC